MRAAYDAGFDVSVAPLDEIKGVIVSNINRISNDGPLQGMSYAYALSMLLDNGKRRNTLSKALTAMLRVAADSYGAFFFETPATSVNTVRQQTFEFVLIAAPSLKRIKPDPNAFSEHFERESPCNVVTFKNLRRDSILVSPCPVDDDTNYAHFATFIQTASPDQIADLWQIVGIEMKMC